MIFKLGTVYLDYLMRPYSTPYEFLHEWKNVISRMRPAGVSITLYHLALEEGIDTFSQFLDFMRDNAKLRTVVKSGNSAALFIAELSDTHSVECALRFNRLYEETVYEVDWITMRKIFHEVV